ncbi:MAG: hypothetical protein V3U64_00125 [Cocleimonas sp.]
MLKTNAYFVNKRIIFTLFISVFFSSTTTIYGSDEEDNKTLLKSPIQLITAEEDVRSPNLCIKLNTTMNSIIDSFNTITDTHTAKAALPELFLSTTKLGELSGLMEQIPYDGVGQVSLVVTKRAPERQSAIKKISRIEGVSEIIEPLLENLAKSEAIYAKFLKDNPIQ